MGAWATVTAIRVQDLYRQIWFNWDNGAWNSPPQIEAWGGCYIAAWATNNAPTARNMALKLIESGSVLTQKVESVPAGAGFGIEWTGAFVPPAVRTITIEVWIDNWVETTMVFDIGVYTRQPDEPDEPDEPAGKLCLLATAGVPASLLCWLRVAVRDKLPLWLVGAYYRLSVWLLNVG